MLYLACEKNENEQKEAGFGPFFKKNATWNRAKSIFQNFVVVGLAPFRNGPFRSISPNQCDQIKIAKCL